MTNGRADQPVASRLRRIERRAASRSQTVPQYLVSQAIARFASTAPAKLLIRATRRRLLIGIGDSHMTPLAVAQSRHLLRRTVIAATVVEGATVSGLRNPNSITQARPTFLRALRGIDENSTVLVNLGEVDVGFLVFLQAARSGTAVRTATDEAFARFTDFVEHEILSRGARVIVVSAILPVVLDYSTWDGLDNARAGVTATRDERAAETRHWNERCRSWASTTGASWFDLTPHTVGPDGHVAPDWFAGPNDHHLDVRRHAELLASMLRAEGFS